MAKKVYIDFELKYKEAVKNLDEMQSEYSKLEKQVDKTSDSQEKLGGILDSTTGGAITKFKGLKGTLGTVIKSFKSLKVAVMATGIGLLVVAVGALATMFTNSEKGQNRFTKLMSGIGVVVGNVTDIVAGLGEVMFNVFTGRFGEAKKSYDELREKMKNFGKETREEIKKSNELSDQRAKADKLERQLLIDRAEATRKFNELREKAADKENVSVDERIRLLKEAGAIEEAITIKEIEAARIRFETKKQENLMSGSTKDDLDEQAQLQARLIELEASRLKKQKTLTAEITTNLREAESERKAIVAKKVADEKEAERLEKEGIKKMSDLKKQIRDAEAVSKEEKRALELIKIEEHFQNLLLQAEEQNLVTDELDAARRQALVSKQAEYDAEDDAKAKAKADKKTAEREKGLAEEERIEASKRAIKEKTFNNAVHLAGAESRLGRTMLLAKQILIAKEAIMNFKADVVKATAAMGNVSLTAAEASVQTTSSIAKAANVAPPPFNLPFIATALATALSVMSAVKAAKGKTKQVASTLGGGRGIDVSVPSPSISTQNEIESIIPQFNTVGASGTNQLASVLGGQPPIQAFVVSNDVTTAQELDRNIITGASLG
jgi:hypothetical protein